MAGPRGLGRKKANLNVILWRLNFFCLAARRNLEESGTILCAIRAGIVVQIVSGAEM